MQNERTRFLIFLAGGMFILASVAARVWLAASGGYNQGGPYPFIRVSSAVALAAGFLLAGAAVLWPRKKKAGMVEAGPKGQPPTNHPKGKADGQG